MFGSVREVWDTGRGLLSGLVRGADRQSGIRVFRYHGVVEKKIDPLLERNQHLLDVFRSQMAYLRRFRVFALDELLDWLDRGRPLAGSAAVVTFDDGFANNLIVAEVMKSCRLPWCLFAPVGEIGENRAMWLDEISLLLLAGEAKKIEILGSAWPLTSREDRERAFRQVRPGLKALPAASKRQAMAAIRSQFPPEESRRLVERFPGLRMLSWRELEGLAAAGVEIGSHGVHHDIHHSEQPREDRLRELSESRRGLESRLGRPGRAVSFTNGDYVGESPEEAASAGYAVAFTTDARAVRRDDSRYLLPRLAAPRSLRRFVRVHWFKDPPPTARIVVAPAGARP
jgi:peptidoglycan/xylan/chitin deacetylase (PgdA/CDA1 family)